MSGLGVCPPRTRRPPAGTARAVWISGRSREIQPRRRRMEAGPEAESCPEVDFRMGSGLAGPEIPPKAEVEFNRGSQPRPPGGAPAFFTKR